MPADFTPLTTLYVQDVDLLTWASADYHRLVPLHQRPAWGVDGVFLSGDLWYLTSASANFLGQGVAIGMIVRLFGPKGAFPTAGDLLAVAAVDSGGVMLERATGPFNSGATTAIIGQPPSPPAGLTGVSFEVLTLINQIEAACYEINREVGINAVRGIPVTRIFDLRELLEITAYKVLCSQYFDRARADTESKDTFLAKSKVFQARYDALRDRMSLHLTQTLASQDDTQPLGGRLVR